MPSSCKDPGPGLHSMTPYSLYLPFAGFLWSDHLVCEPQTGAFETEERFRAIQDLQDGEIPRRVIMKDPIGRFTPWIFQKDLSHSSNDDLEQGLLMNREPGVLRSV